VPSLSWKEMVFEVGLQLQMGIRWTQCSLTEDGNALLIICFAFVCILILIFTAKYLKLSL